MSISARFVHANIVAQDWKRLADFYHQVFGCTPVPPSVTLPGIGSKPPLAFLVLRFTVSIFGCPAMGQMGQRWKSSSTTSSGLGHDQPSIGRG